MSRFVITSGKRYMDIDGYAGIIAYKNLLVSLGEDAIAVSSAPCNKSVSSLIQEIPLSLDVYEKTEDEKYIILDVSSPDMFDPIVDDYNIVEVIDHHTGFEKYWKEKEKVQDTIEFIGSVCTIIFEKYEFFHKLDLLDKNLCKLLIAGILDNTLNLQANITTQRDIDAFHKLLKIGNIETIWIDQYFLSCQEEILKNVPVAIRNDLKIEEVNKMLPKVFGQLLLWDKELILKRKKEIENILNTYDKKWLLNLICLKEGKSYLICHDKATQENLEELFSLTFEKDIMVLSPFTLRKEIMKKAREYINNI